MEFDWSRAGHAEGAILSCRMTILPSDVIYLLKNVQLHLQSHAFVYNARRGCCSVMSQCHVTV